MPWVGTCLVLLNDTFIIWIFLNFGNRCLRISSKCAGNIDQYGPWVFPKIGLLPNHPFVHRVFHCFHHPFWGVFLFLETPTWFWGHFSIIFSIILVGEWKASGRAEWPHKFHQKRLSVARCHVVGWKNLPENERMSLLKMDGWFRCIPYWNSPFLGDIC